MRRKKMKKNNLFMYATSELSQDAFICWLMNFAHKDHLNEDVVLTNCAKELLSKIIRTGEDLTVTDIKRQYKNIDVLLEVNSKYHIIIEDKTFSGQHDDQIERYRMALKDKGKDNIICVYYKIVEQAFDEKTDVNITRLDLITLFSKYINKSQNNIFNDYYDYLLAIDKDVKSYQSTPIEEWRIDYNHAYKGFFTHLIKEGIIQTDRYYDWGYVPNQSSGFWGLRWFYLKREELDACFQSGALDDLYLQIEDNVIAVKMAKTESTDSTVAIRWNLYDYFKSKTPEFNKKPFRKGKWMTVGYIQYNEKNYKEKIQLMQGVMQSIVDGDYKKWCNNIGVVEPLRETDDTDLECAFE